MFTTEHLIWIGICAAFVLIMNLICRGLNLSLRVSSAASWQPFAS